MRSGLLTIVSTPVDKWNAKVDTFASQGGTFQATNEEMVMWYEACIRVRRWPIRLAGTCCHLEVHSRYKKEARDDDSPCIVVKFPSRIRRRCSLLANDGSC